MRVLDESIRYYVKYGYIFDRISSADRVNHVYGFYADKILNMTIVYIYLPCI